MKQRRKPTRLNWCSPKSLCLSSTAGKSHRNFSISFSYECHRSIYNVWRQVIEYFDAYLIGLTATPDNRTYGFFRKNVVSEYPREKAIADGVNVGDEVYVIETERTKSGGKITARQLVEKRERFTRKKRWELQDED